ncbi:MAG TPA: hypothetical protein VMH02_12415 [Verrucomicrobiae bacterium]|nr:hypothetical protein [Verrucomicrobiae bacterium]
MTTLAANLADTRALAPKLSGLQACCAANAVGLYVRLYGSAALDGARERDVVVRSHDASAVAMPGDFAVAVYLVRDAMETGRLNGSPTALKDASRVSLHYQAADSRDCVLVALQPSGEPTCESLPSYLVNLHDHTAVKAVPVS